MDARHKLVGTAATERPVTLAIVGGGPNCLYVLERLYAHLGTSPASIAIEVYDANGSFGSGCHYPWQPSTNHLNRAADQISFGADESNLEDVRVISAQEERGTLFDWCRRRYAATADERYNIDPRAWVERRLFGEASADVFARTVERLAGRGVAVRLNTAAVEDIEEVQPEFYLVHSRGEQGCRTAGADFIVICTGHGETMTKEGSLERAFEAHATRHIGTRYIHHVYPIESITLSLVPPGCTVACRGMGLAAIDFLLRVTEGRGGRFSPEGDGEDLKYLPSGLEPKTIVPFCGSGVFLFTRAYNQKMNDGSLYHRGVFFTHAMIDRLRQVVGVPKRIANVGTVRQLDFERHALPLIQLEMALLYYKKLFGRAATESSLGPTAQRVLSFTGQLGPWHTSSEAATNFLMAPIEAVAHRVSDAISAVLEGRSGIATLRRDERDALIHFLGVLYGREAATALGSTDGEAAFVTRIRDLRASPPRWRHNPDPRSHLFSWADIVDPLRGAAGAENEAREAAAIDHLRKDISQAVQGNLDNPLKAAIDGVWRDLRDTIRYVVEFGGLTAPSHARFVEVYARTTNRIAVGTSLDIMRKVLALAASGYVDLSFSRMPRVQLGDRGGFEIRARRSDATGVRASVMVNARVHRFDLHGMKSVLFANLARRGLVREWVNPGETGVDFRTGGLDVQRGTNLAIRDNGSVNPTIAVLGPPTEGPLYFHLAAARPYCGDPVIVDADRIACKFLKRLARRDRRKEKRAQKPPTYARACSAV